MKITTIKTRLLVTIMVTSLLSLCIACLIYSLYDLSRYRSSKENELKQLVQLISPLLSQELAASDSNPGLWQKLVAENKGIQRIVLYQSDFTVINEYSSSLAREKQLSPRKEMLISFDGDYCTYNAPLLRNGKNIGYISVDYYLFDRGYGFRSIVLVFTATFIFASIVAYLISSILQVQFSKSIISLVDVAKSIYRDKNYNARAVKQSNDEFGLLTDTINEMLDEISRREDEMRNLNDHLESRVETRTAALQEINSRLLNEKNRADHASSVKSDFLANMSHEIRTPMNGIVASCDLAVAEELSPKVANYLKIIQSSSHTLLLIINDILDFSELEAGTLALEEAPFSLAELLRTLDGVFREQATQHKINFTLDVDPQTPDILVGDRGRFQQVLSNFLDNGIKFTPEGQVSLNIICLEKNEENVILECRICDTGVGLSEDSLNAIFQSFHQIDSSSTRKFGGTGLGLAITKKLAIMMGGTIEVSSHLGEGSSFVVTLRFGWKSTPLLAQTSPIPTFQQHSKGNPEDLIGKHVLLAEDNETSRGVAEALLTGLGLTVDSVENGELALQALECTEYDFVILDIQMPVLDGYETMHQIRAQNQYNDLAIIALTAHALPGDEEKCLQAGANAYLSKPISQNRVRDILCRFCQGAPGSDLPQSTMGTSDERSVILDVNRAAKKLGVELDIYYKVLSTFYNDYEHVDVDFRKAIADGDMDWVQKKMHSLKGSGATIGAEKLTGLATSMDLLCKEGRLPDSEQVHSLLLELHQVKKEAKQFVNELPILSQKTDHLLEVVNDVGLEDCFHALAKALDESLYNQINREIKKLEGHLTGSLVVNLGKIIRMYAYDDALELLHEIGDDLGFSFDNDKDVD